MKTLLFKHNNAKEFSVKTARSLCLLIFLLSILLLPSCSDNDEEAKRYVVKVTVNYPEGYNGLASGVEVKAVNSQTGSSTAATTDASGIAQFNLVSGLYNFTVAHETEEFVFNGLKENQTVSQDMAVSVDLHATSLTGGLVFKEYYYVGSPVEGKAVGYSSDQFMEIYNNSDEVIYLDNIGIGCLDPLASSSVSVWVDSNGDLLNVLPLSGYSFYIEGSGKDHPLEPRTSIVIAQDGIDHQTDPLGNPASPVNLGNATWETYVGDINNGKDADAAGVPNLTLLSTTTTTQNDALYSVFGPALIMFRFPEGVDPAAFAANASNLSTKPGTSAATQYLMIPKEYVVDAIECVYNDPGKRNKRIHSDLDAGYTFITGGTYNGKSVRRKVKQIIDGKVIYKDTNNSTEDFLKDQTPTPFVHPVTVD